MTKHLRRHALAALAVLASAAVAACGGDGEDGGGKFASGLPVDGQKKGGTLRVLSDSDFDSIDPGQAYYQLTYMVTYATQRPLYSFRPDKRDRPVPDLAAAEPRVTDGGRTVTIRIRPGVRYSAPVDRTVRSADVKYAIERAFSASVNNGYAASYFGDLAGVKAFQDGRSDEIVGLQAPDETTLVMRFDRPIGATSAQALTLPISVPVPEEHARRFDAKEQSDYGANQVFTGPYRIASYAPGRRIVLERNPRWNGPQTGDYRPAHLDRVEWTIGANPTVSARQILSRRDMVGAESPPAPALKQAVQRRPGQIAFTPLGNHYVVLNTAIAPFDDENLRKAVVAATDRTRLRLTRGGESIGDVATHFLSPGAPGFEDAGGAEGPGFDFLAKPQGDPELAREYMRKAGFPSGRYSGPPILMVADNGDPDAATAQVVLQQLRELGFRVRFRALARDTMYTRFCAVPRARVHVCPSMGWVPDFNDGYAYLYAPFNGGAIAPENNSNWPQLRDARIDAAMERAARLSDPEQRARAWGEIDRLVTARAPAIPWLWDRQPNIQSRNVQGVIAQWNASWDLSFTSLK
jgi:peptide/nickel transport system substrate-binding protein